MGVASVSNLFRPYIYKSLQSLELDQNRKKVVFGWDRNVLVQVLVDNRAVSVGEGGRGQGRKPTSGWENKYDKTKRFFFSLSQDNLVGK